MKVLVATTNRGKLEEIREILTYPGKDVLGLDDVHSVPEPDETGTTFGENALIKARYYYTLTGLLTIADDSGLEVEELEGGPGVKSARYAGLGATDQDRIDKLLAELNRVDENCRGARFVCAAAIIWEHGQRLFVEEVSGKILNWPRGSSGFGYDPLFYYPQLNKTFAELSKAQKSEVSHRGKAFRRLAWWLQEGFLDWKLTC